VLPFDQLAAPLISNIETGFSGRLEGRTWADGETGWTGGASGVYAGGALVEVHGHHFANRTQVGGRLSCRFGMRGAATVEATYVSERLVRCYAPSADTAALADEWSSDFDDGAPPARSVLLGDAHLIDGSLVLTEPRVGQIGGLVIEPINRGARYFDARFGVLIGGGVGGTQPSGAAPPPAAWATPPPAAAGCAAVGPSVCCWRVSKGGLPVRVSSHARAVPKLTTCPCVAPRR